MAMEDVETLEADLQARILRESRGGYRAEFGWLRGDAVVVQVKTRCLKSRTKSESSPSILRSGMRPQTPLSELARVLQTGRLKIPINAPYGSRWFEAEPADDGKCAIPAVPARRQWSKSTRSAPSRSARCTGGKRQKAVFGRRRRRRHCGPSLGYPALRRWIFLCSLRSFMLR